MEQVSCMRSLTFSCLTGTHRTGTGGQNALFSASGNGKLAVVEVVRKNSETSMDYARREGHIEICNMLSEVSRPATRTVLPHTTEVVPALRFKCHASGCHNSEQSLQRVLRKCDRCRAVRYCSTECMLADASSHQSYCSPPSDDEFLLCAPLDLVFLQIPGVR